jgi:hypothetical protein
VHEALRQQADDAWIAVQGTTADHGRGTVIEIEHRREGEIDAAGAQLTGQHIAAGPRRGECAQRVLHPQLSQHAHGGQVREAVAGEALHATALVVDGNQHIGADRLDLGRQRGELGAALEVAREQDQATGQRVLEAMAVVGIEHGAGHIEHDRAMGGGFKHRQGPFSAAARWRWPCPSRR